MKVFQFLFGGRRWALYLPFLVSFVFVRGSSYPMSFWLVAGVSCLVGIPYWLYYWLSNAFRDIEIRPFNSW